jgi:hypothetical protein
LAPLEQEEEVVEDKDNNNNDSNTERVEDAGKAPAGDTGAVDNLEDVDNSSSNYLPVQ